MFFWSYGKKLRQNFGHHNFCLKFIVQKEEFPIGQQVSLFLPFHARNWNWKQYYIRLSNFVHQAPLCSFTYRWISFNLVAVWSDDQVKVFEGSTQLRLCFVELWLSWGFDNIIKISVCVKLAGFGWNSSSFGHTEPVDNLIIGSININQCIVACIFYSKPTWWNHIQTFDKEMRSKL